MSKKGVRMEMKGVARVKKFDATQDVEIDEPIEVLEKKFSLAQEQAEMVQSGGTIIIENGNVEVR